MLNPFQQIWEFNLPATIFGKDKKNAIRHTFVTFKYAYRTDKSHKDKILTIGIDGEQVNI